MKMDDALKQSFVLEIMPSVTMLLTAGYLVRDGEAMADLQRRTGERAADPLAQQAVRLDQAMEPWRRYGRRARTSDAGSAAWAASIGARTGTMNTVRRRRLPRRMIVCAGRPLGPSSPARGLRRRADGPVSPGSPRHDFAGRACRALSGGCS